MRHTSSIVSIIIPVYNTAEYLKECIESVISQSYSFLDIVIVDDGSSDGSELICDYYSKLDSRIKVIHKKNNGLVSARKSGISNSVGDYITYVDSDDYIDSKLIEKMMNIMQSYEPDIIQCGARILDIDGRILDYKEPLHNGLYNLSDNEGEFYSHLLWDFSANNQGIRSNLWSTLFKKNIVFEYQNAVYDQIINGEDDACFYPAVLNAKSFFFLEDKLYTYRRREKSMSLNSSMFSLEQNELIYECIRPHISNLISYDIENQYKRYLFERVNKTLRMGYGVSAKHGYRLPCNLIPYGSKVIVFGAGVVGRDYVEENAEINWFSLVAWMDSKKEGDIGGIEIIKPRNLDLYDYDYILISTAKADLFDEMKKELIVEGINEKKILWTNPVMDNHSFVIRYNNAL